MELMTNITKPFAIEELLARIEAILRPVSAVKDSANIIEYKDIVLNLESRIVQCNGEVVNLTTKEYEL